MNKLKVIGINDGSSYAIAEGDTWRPGVYESKEAAWLAFELKDKVLIDLQSRTTDENNNLITLKMLKIEMDK